MNIKRIKNNQYCRYIPYENKKEKRAAYTLVFFLFGKFLGRYRNPILSKLTIIQKEPNRKSKDPLDRTGYVGWKAIIKEGYKKRERS